MDFYQTSYSQLSNIFRCTFLVFEGQVERPLQASNDHKGEGNNHKGKAEMRRTSRAEAVRDAAVTVVES